MEPTFERPSGRTESALRSLRFERGFTRHAEGSVLVCLGDTKVICTVSVNQGVPAFLRGSGEGWLTAEYGMLPRSTGSRMDREAIRGKQTGRTVEIQRFIGRSLRAALDLSLLGERTLIVDCDVIQADGGTRTASISGSCVAVVDALNELQRSGDLKTDPLKHLVCAVSVGIWNGHPIVDLDYAEDSTAQSDINVVLTEEGSLIEVQGTAEGAVFSQAQLMKLLELAAAGGYHINEAQKQALKL